MASKVLIFIIAINLILQGCNNLAEVVIDKKAYFNERNFLLGSKKQLILKSAEKYGLIFDCDQNTVPYMKDSTFCSASDHDTISINFYFLNNILVQRVSVHKFKDSASIKNFLTDFKLSDNFQSKEKRITVKEANTENIFEIFKLKEEYEVWYNSKMVN